MRQPIAPRSRSVGEDDLPWQVSTADLVTVGSARTFLAHQSVGAGILAAVPAVYAAHGLSTPTIRDLAEAAPDDPIVHTRIGANGHPLGKIAAFAALLREGLGTRVDIAALKLCYADIRADTDVAAVSTVYLDTVAALREEFPELTVLAATVPLTTRRDSRGMLRQWLGRGDRHGPEHALPREQFNTAVRAASADGGLLLDIAALESTSASGRPVTGRYRGQRYHALDRAKARDHGHLAEQGARTVAGGFLAALARTLRE